MFGILVSAFYTVLAWVVRSILVKFVLFFGLYFVTTEFIQVLVSLLPNSSVLSSAFTGIPPGMWWMMDIMQFNVGVPMCLSAYLTRFIIRRVPVIG
jgi:hypothetical protein